jgi:hypothetical protein
MIDRQGGRICIECDSCDEVFEGEPRAEWAETWAAAKADGWKSKQIGGDWVHGCKRCGV